MNVPRISLLCCTFMLVFLFQIAANDTTVVKKKRIVRSVSDIPHKTFKEKLLWPHRTFVFRATRARPVNYDTAYIRSYSKKFVIALPLSTRFLRFSLLERESGNRLNFVPNEQYNLGFCVSSRWASFIINSKIKIYSGDENIKGKTSYRDYQLNLFGRRVTTDLLVQFYDGFFIKNSRSFSSYASEQPYSIRADVSAINLGISSYYIFNNKKFSYRGTFGFTEQQKKSAGSLLFGIYYSFFKASSGSSLVTESFRESFDSTTFLRSGQTHNFGLNIGYIYTLVFLKRCYVTASLVQGFGGTQLFYTRDEGSTEEQRDAGPGKMHARFGLGYDHGNYFIGTSGMFDVVLFNRNSNSTLSYSYGKFMLYFGYRFSVLKGERRLLKRLKLADY